MKKSKYFDEAFIPMKGYLKNNSVYWVHIFKQSVKPGGKVSLESLYEVYGQKNSLKRGEPFVSWLRNVKLKNRDGWQIVLNNPEAYYEDPESVEDLGNNEFSEINIADSVVMEKNASEQTKVLKAPKYMEVGDIVKLTVKEAKEILPMLNDIKTLKYALKMAKPRAHSDTLCRLLEKRIREVEVLH